MLRLKEEFSYVRLAIDVAGKKVGFTTWHLKVNKNLNGEVPKKPLASDWLIDPGHAICIRNSKRSCIYTSYDDYMERKGYFFSDATEMIYLKILYETFNDIWE